MSPEQARRVLSALHGLAEANWADFTRFPALCCAYEKDLRRGRFIYVDDKITCGRDDCWSTYRDLRKRYNGQANIPLDCEDASCAHAGWLVAQCYDNVYVGLVVGRKISHCIMGVKRPDGGMIVVDPSRWYGMRETTYAGAMWLKLNPKNVLNR